MPLDFTTQTEDREIKAAQKNDCDSCKALIEIIETFDTRCSELVEEKEKAEGEYEDLRKQYNELDAKLIDMTQAKDNAEIQLAASNREIELLKEQVSDLKSDRENFIN